MDNNNNSGYRNSGDRNSGDWNSGDRNSGDRNSGDLNSGDWNSGDLNSGDWNSGYRNSGDRNSGDWNSGDRNSGDWNSGYRNSGYLNTKRGTVRIFDVQTDIPFGEIDFPNYFYFNLNNWRSEKEMTDKEKDAYPSYATCGGFLKCRDYKQAWRESWDKATTEDKNKTLELPEWNNKIFKEISGIDVEKELSLNNENGKKIKELREKAEEMLNAAKELENNINNK